MDKFIIWGAGVLGRRAAECIGVGRIAAFIEGNLVLTGEEYRGIPIMSYEACMDRYRDCSIIISPMKYKEIVDRLKECGIKNYFILSEFPVDYLDMDFVRVANECLKRAEKCRTVIFGNVTLFHYVLYLYMKNRTALPIRFLEMEKEKKEVFHELKYIPQKAIREDDLLITAGDTGKEAINCQRFDWPDMDRFSRKISDERLKQFRNIHKGRRCFIVATGPSLRMEDLELLHRNKEICISMNQIFHAFRKVEWRPDYYIVGDGEVVKDYRNEIIQLPVKNKFITDYYMPFWDQKLPDNIFRFHEQPVPLEAGKITFSEDIDKVIYGGGTVTFCCLQIAVYMGFREIYLLGVDHSIKGKGTDAGNHFCEDYFEKSGLRKRIESVDTIKGLEGTTLSYKTAEAFAQEHGIKIFNATRGGALEIFQRVDFDSLFD